MSIKITWYKDSPDIGSDECVCSYCEFRIDNTAVRIINTDHNCELRFHPECYQKVSAFIGGHPAINTGIQKITKEALYG